MVEWVASPFSVRAERVRFPHQDSGTDQFSDLAVNLMRQFPTKSRQRRTRSVMICCFAKFINFHFDYFKTRAGTNSQLIKSKKSWKTKIKIRLLIKEDSEQKLILLVDFIKIPRSKFNLGCKANYSRFTKNNEIWGATIRKQRVTCQRKASNKKLICLLIS